MKTAVIKANRKGSREAELENKTGWTAKHKVFASVKTYKRKLKHNNHEKDSL
jgi:hypothetical protein